MHRLLLPLLATFSPLLAQAQLPAYSPLRRLTPHPVTLKLPPPPAPPTPLSTLPAAAVRMPYLLWIVDGQEMSYEQMRQYAAARRVRRMRLVQPRRAIALYGARAADGAVRITTKPAAAGFVPTTTIPKGIR